MTARARDRLVGSVIVVIAVLWCWGVLSTIPGAYGEARLGPQGFPLGLGVLLGILGLGLLSSANLADSAAATPENADDAKRQRAAHLWAASATIVLVLGYAILLKYLGFLIATAVTVVIAVVWIGGIGRIRLAALMAVGIALGIYLVLGSLLGVYLPYGRWINLAF